MTASWFAKLPAGAVPVGISRGVPRGKTGYHRLRELEPGPWFASVPPEQYLTRYRKILDGLDAGAIRDQLLGYGDMPVMLCWEAAHDCHAGSKWCHRHLAAQWLGDRLGIEVREVGFPDLDRFAYLRKIGIPAPNYRAPFRAAAGNQIGAHPPVCLPSDRHQLAAEPPADELALALQFFRAENQKLAREPSQRRRKPTVRLRPE